MAKRVVILIGLACMYVGFFFFSLSSSLSLVHDSINHIPIDACAY